MQTSQNALDTTILAHQKTETVLLTQADEQIVVYDSRLRNWMIAASDDLVVAYPVRAILNEDDEILRIRTLANGTLEIVYGDPLDSIIWSANAISVDALAGSGVDLVVDGADIYSFWLDADGVTIKTATSADSGHTWGAASTVATLPAQAVGVLPQLCAPSKDAVVYTNSTVNQDDEGDPLTALFITVRVAGVWNTPSMWSLDGQPLGVEEPITLPNGDAYPSNLSGLSLASGRLALAFYANGLRESFETSVWLQRVSNVDYTNATQHLHWVDPQEIFPTLPIDTENNTTQIFAAFPRLQVVGDEYWIVALESSEFAGHERYHLAFFRSTDGIVWSDRNYHQGAASDEQEAAYCYNGSQPFLLTDLIYANLVVTPERTFIVGYDKVFFCPSTILVGEDNPARRLDLTPYVEQYTMNLPAAPTTSTVNYQASSTPLNYDGSDILSAHRGVIIKHKAGYYDPADDTDKLIDLGLFNVDQITDTSDPQSTNATIQASDNTSLLNQWKADTFWEYKAPSQMAFDRFCDLIPFIKVQGNFNTSRGGNLKSSVVVASDNFIDNIFALNLPQSGNGILATRFRCSQTWEDNHGGVTFQGRDQGDEADNKTFWAILYNKVANRFTLHRAIPRVNSNRIRLYKYRSFLQQSSSIALNANQSYYLRVKVYHNHIMAEYGSDGINWTKVIDYTSPSSPVNSVVPCRIGWWGLNGTARTEPSGALGQRSTANGQEDLSDGSFNPIIVARHVQLGDRPSLLRRIAVAVTSENDTEDPMPDGFLMLISGDGTEPDDATDEDNVIYSGTPSSLLFNTHENPSWTAGNAVPNPTRPRFAANEHVWVAASFSGTLVAGQSYKWASFDGGGTSETKVSTDGGATWADLPNPNINLAAVIEVEYLAGLVKFHNLYFGSGENIRTYENLAHEIVAKAGVLDIVADSWLQQSDLTLGADSIYWQPTMFGTIGDLVLDVDVDTTDTARVIIGSSTIDAGDGDGFIIELDSLNQRVRFYSPSNILMDVSEPLQYIPAEFHLTIVNQNDFLYVYVNECLAMLKYVGEVEAGYVGLDSADTTWTNARIPDLHQLVEQFDIEARQTALGALQNLIATPAPGTTSRVKFFINYAGKLRIGSFARRAVVDTYEDTLFNSTKTQSSRYTVSGITASGNYYSRRMNPRMLNTDGYIYDERNVTAARSDADAYAATADEFRDAEEKELTYGLTHLPVWATEKEDLHRIINPADHTSGDLVVNDIEFTYSPNNTSEQATMRLGYRDFAGELDE